MKRFLIVLCALLIASPVLAEMTQQQAKEELADKGFLYGCTPANWSLAEPSRGGFNWAVQKGRIDIMELEVNAGLNVSSCGKDLPTLAVLKNQSEALNFLLKNGYDVNGKHPRMSILNFAVWLQKEECVKVLLDNGANPNLETAGYYPLNVAIKKKNPEIVKMLLDAGAKPNEKTYKLIKKTNNQQIKNYFENI